MHEWSRLSFRCFSIICIHNRQTYKIYNRNHIKKKSENMLYSIYKTTNYFGTTKVIQIEHIIIYINLYRHVFCYATKMNYSNKRTKVVRIKGQGLFTANIHFLVVVFSYCCLSSILPKGNFRRLNAHNFCQFEWQQTFC